MNTDDKIRAILQAEADEVEPSAAGFDAIRTGIAARQRRRWWFRGTALAGALATVTAFAFAVAAHDTRRHTIHQVSPGPTTSEQPSPTATVPPPAVDPATPTGTIWPLTTQGEVDAWLADQSRYPSLRTPEGAALALARHYFGVPDVTVAKKSDLTYEMHRPGQAAAVATLDVAGLGPDAGAPYVVRTATNANLVIGKPAPGAALDSPVALHGTYHEVDPSIWVTIRGDTDANDPVNLATDRATNGPPNDWDVTLTFTTALRTGSVMAINTSNKDGGLAEATAVPVTFGATDLPATYVTVRDGGVAIVSTADDKVVRRLTPAQPGGGAFDAQLTADGKSVVFGQGTMTCGSSIQEVPIGGGLVRTLVPAAAGYVFGMPSKDGDVLAYRRVGCNAPNAQQVVVVTPSGTTVEPVDALDWGITVRGRFVLYVDEHRDGTTTLHELDAQGEFADAPTAPPAGCSWNAVTFAEPDNAWPPQVVAAAACGNDTRLYRLAGDLRQRTLLGHVPGGLAVASIDADRTGRAFLLDAIDPALDPATREGAYVWAGGTVSRVSHLSQRPSWS